jgi:hypothetical protein
MQEPTHIDVPPQSGSLFDEVTPRLAKSNNDMKKDIDICFIDVENGDETLAVTVYAFTSREAISIARKKLHGSPLLRKITHAAYRI